MDLREKITQSIIDLIERGVAKGLDPLGGLPKLGMPINASTGKEYNGVNIVALWTAASERNYLHNDWLTYRQAEAMGAQVRKGASGVCGAYYKSVKRKDGATVSTDDERDCKAQTRLIMLPFFVFNRAEIDNLPSRADAQREVTPTAQAEELIKASGAVFKFTDTRGLYRDETDEIFIAPAHEYKNDASFYRTALHELIHWTGHASRLGRDSLRDYHTDTKIRAFEELTAELGAAFLMARFGLVDATLEKHASYIESWLQLLKEDKTAIFRASKQASEAYQFLVSKLPVVEPEEMAA